MSRDALCVICGSGSRPLFEKYGYWIRECEGCGHQFAEIEQSDGHVRQIYGDHYFNGDPAGYPDYLAEGDLLIAHGRKYARMLRRYMKPGTVLDVGTAAGFILKGFEEGGWTCRGIEPNVRMAEYARSDLGLAIEAVSLEQVESSDTYDLVTMIQVVMHFINPREALRLAAEITRPGGYWLIETWNRESWTARMFRESWQTYSPPSVLHWFSIMGLRILVEGLGFDEVGHGRPQKWVRASHATALLRYKFEESVVGRLVGGLIGVVPQRVAVPYLGDDIFWGLYRKRAMGKQRASRDEDLGRREAARV